MDLKRRGSELLRGKLKQPRVMSTISYQDIKAFNKTRKCISLEDAVAFEDITASNVKSFPCQIHGEKYKIDLTSFKKLCIPRGVEEIKCGERQIATFEILEDLEFGENSEVDFIGYRSFADCKNLKKITFPDSLKQIGNKSFANCKNLKNITLPASLEIIGLYSFQDCSALQKVVFEDNSKLRIIARGAFAGCAHLKEIVIPASVTSIGMRAFEGCAHLKEIVIPASVTEIRGLAFLNCKALERVTFEANSALKGIIYSAFLGCDNLKEITIPPNATYQTFLKDSSDSSDRKDMSISTDPQKETRKKERNKRNASDKIKSPEFIPDDWDK